MGTFLHPRELSSFGRSPAALHRHRVVPLEGWRACLTQILRPCRHTAVVYSGWKLWEPKRWNWKHSWAQLCAGTQSVLGCAGWWRNVWVFHKDLPATKVPALPLYSRQSLAFGDNFTSLKINIRLALWDGWQLQRMCRHYCSGLDHKWALEKVNLLISSMEFSHGLDTLPRILLYNLGELQAVKQFWSLAKQPFPSLKVIHFLLPEQQPQSLVNEVWPGH